MVQMLFPNNAIFQDDNLPIHTAGSVHSCFEEHEDALQHLPCCIQFKPLWLVIESNVGSRFPPPSPFKQIDVLHEEWYDIPLETI